jgi:hypothetical protein
MTIRSVGPRRARGHATMLTVILFAVSALAVTGMYNVGQQTTSKVRLQTVSDSAAYSVGTVVARDLNFKAYTNRAMVANQIAVAQMIGLASWSRMLRHAGQNFRVITSALSIIPVIGQALAVIGNVIERGSNIIDQAITQMARVVVPIQEVLIDTLSEAQRVFHFATLAMARETMTTVVDRSDRDVDTGALATNGVFWGSFMRTWEGQQERYSPQRVNDNRPAAREARARVEEFRRVTEASGDRFVTRVHPDGRFRDSRTYSWFDLSVWPLMGLRMRKYGGSEFMPTRNNQQVQNYSWTAMDSVGFEVRTCCRSFGRWRSWNEIAPFGWGAAHALSNGRTNYEYGDWQNRNARRADGSRRWGNGTWELPMTTSVGAQQYRTRNLASSRGIRSFYDLQARGRLQDSVLNVQVVLLKRADRMRTWNNVLRGAGQQPQPLTNVEERGGMAGDTMATLAKSGIYFSRDVNPFLDSRIGEADWRRADRQREYGNMYNPFWQVRLLPSTNAERTAALAFAQIRL